MNGVKFLLDSCFIIRWRQQDEQAFCLFEQFNVEDGQCAYSDISYVEVFGWNGLQADDEQHFKTLLTGLPRLAINDDILEYTIMLRKNYRIKLPDALILATACVYKLQLLTLDDKLQKIYQELQLA